MTKRENPVIKTRDEERPRLLELRWRMVFFGVPVVLSALFLIALSHLAEMASVRGLFYMRVETAFVIALTIIPASWVFLTLKWKRKGKTAKNFLLVTVPAMLLILSGSTAIETINTLPVVQIENNFEVPAGWVKQTEGNGTALSPGRGLLPCADIMGNDCPYLKSTWEKTSHEPLTLDDLGKIADDNGFNDFVLVRDTNAEGSSSLTSSMELKGEVQDNDVSLSFYGYEDNWELRLYINYR